MEIKNCSIYPRYEESLPKMSRIPEFALFMYHRHGKSNRVKCLPHYIGQPLILQLSLLVDQEFGGLSFPVAGFGDGLMDPAPERPCENEVDAEAGAHLEAGDEATDLGHAEGNWDECARSSAPFWEASSTRIAARKASASIDRVMCRYQPCQLRTS